MRGERREAASGLQKKEGEEEELAEYNKENGVKILSAASAGQGGAVIECMRPRDQLEETPQLRPRAAWTNPSVSVRRLMLIPVKLS